MYESREEDQSGISLPKIQITQHLYMALANLTYESRREEDQRGADDDLHDVQPPTKKAQLRKPGLTFK
jgi:hypothetical protein